MGYRIVTPSALWQDFNPVRDPLEVSVSDVRSGDGYVEKSMVFTAETVIDGKIRAYADALIRKDGPSPTVLFLPAADSPAGRIRFFDALVERGFNVIVVDYSGFSEKKDRYTVYPKTLDYCNYASHRRLPYEPLEPAQSPWFAWMKVVRRAVTLAFEEAGVDRDNLFLLGYLEGAQLAWKVAGIDGRIRAVVPVGACGYDELADRRKYDGETERIFSDERECWLAGISTQAYARLLTCPVYYVAGTNSVYADIDRAGDLFRLIPHDRKYMAFSAGTAESINYGTFLSVLKWIEMLIESDGNPEIAVPALKTYVSDNMLYASVTGLEDFSNAEIYYALDEVIPAFRRWNLVRKQAALAQSEVLAAILPRPNSKRIFVFATVTYANGLVLSTPETMVDLEKVDLREYDTTRRAAGRFIYNGDMDEMPFSVENYNPVIDDKILEVRTGPFGIKGVTATEGNLCVCNIEPPADGGLDYILQMEVFSQEPRDMEIDIYTAENGSREYSCPVRLTGIPGWQRISLERADFKSADGLPLKDWEMAMELKIREAEGALFGSILWV